MYSISKYISNISKYISNRVFVNNLLDKTDKFPFYVI